MHLDHHHLVISAKIHREITDVAETTEWLQNLVEMIGMEVLVPPQAVYYTEMEGNVGMTAFVIITTSHIVLHTWNEDDPGRLELDIYSCAEFDVPLVLQEVRAHFDASDIRFIWLDRTNDRHSWTEYIGPV